MPKKTIAIFTSSQGHFSIAHGIKDQLEKKYKVHVFFYDDPLTKLYIPIYRFVPFAYTIPFHLSQYKIISDLNRKLAYAKYRNMVEEFCKKVKPDVCISTFLFFNPALEKMQRRYHIPFINVLPDPISIHPFFISEQAQTNFVFNETALEKALHFFPSARFTVGGWFVRKEFKPITSKAEHRKKFGLQPNTLTFLVSAGSEGSNYILKMLPLLFTTKKPLQIIVACGTNKALFKMLGFLKQHIVDSQSPINLVILPFTKKVYEYVQAADLVLGKAGPNTIFESVQTITPFFAITHVSGQETGNLDLIKEYNIGLTEENILKVNTILKNIINKPKMLDSFKPGLLKLAEYNNQAGSKLIAEIEKCFKAVE